MQPQTSIQNCLKPIKKEEKGEKNLIVVINFLKSFSLDLLLPKYKQSTSDDEGLKH